MRYCTNCGAPNVDENQVCDQCKKPLDNNVVPITNNTPKISKFSKKKLLIYATIIVCVLIVLCISIATSMSKSSVNKLRINSFNEIQWGTDVKKFEDSKYLSNMKEGEDYSFQKIDAEDTADYLEDAVDISMCAVKESVAGYEATAIYVFADEKLTGGIYGVEVKRNEKEVVYTDLVEKYTSVYGEKVFEESSERDEYSYSLWIDKESNAVFLYADDSDIVKVFYFERDSVLYSLLDLLFDIDGDYIKNRIKTNNGNVDGI